MAMFRLVESSYFNLIVYSLIIANTVVLALERYDLTEDQILAFKAANQFFTLMFLIEMILKLIGLGVKNYCMDKFNLFDGFIVILSLIELSIELSRDIELDILQIFRALRLLRTVKLARKWKTLQTMLKLMADSLVDISNFSLLLFILIFISALLGMEVFAYSVAFTIDGEAIYD